ncbi:MAG: Xaa-Pro peptidase family protein [Oscillospiraceae bacterium]|jgi:Xaa-Pro aminopeptidase|nr:Xaa-Pro peptidase family protein [Oscillospiraceae bacterium]
MNNLEKLKKAVNDAEFDALLLVSAVNRLYATGFSSSSGYVLITPRDAFFITDSRYIEAARAVVSGAEVLLQTAEDKPAAILNRLLAGAEVRTLAIEESSLTYSEFLAFSSALKAELVKSDGLVDGLRNVKSEAELAAMIETQRIAEKAFLRLLPELSRDLTEKQVANRLLFHMLDCGADDKSFDTIAVSSANSSRPHGVPSDEKLTQGFLTIDFGAKKNGWVSDTTRTVYIGGAGKPSDEERRVYDTVLQAQLAGIAAIRAGVTGQEVDGAAREVIKNAGYGEYFGHGFGHGLGLEVHEALAASVNVKTPLPEGGVISAEPGIYLPGRFGVRIEDVVYVEKDGCRDITELGKELIVL